MAGSQVRITTGQVDFSGGVNSDRVPTIASAQNPNGLPANALAWLVNATVRGGGIYPRRGWKYLGAINASGLFQEARMYVPLSGNPYILSQISGHTYQVRVDLTPFITTDVTISGDVNSTTTPLNWMCQGEQFMVIQDGVNLPLFWDGTTLRRSYGLGSVLAITAANFNAPAIGAVVDVTLTEPYSGVDGQLVYIVGEKYQVINSLNFITIQNITGVGVGTVVPAASTFSSITTGFGPPVVGTEILARTVGEFTVPAALGTVQIPITEPFTGAVNDEIQLNGYPVGSWRFKVTAIGSGPPAANHIFLINLSDAPATVHNAPTNIETGSELPSGTCMDYYMGRLWLANGREYMAGDIVGSPATPTSGTAQYSYTDSILHVTENAYLSLGGTFLVPTQAGDIRALSHPANLDTALGQGQLLALTRNTIYTVNVVPERAAWALLSEPIQRVAQITFGSVGHRCNVQVNGDLFYQSIDGIRSLIQAIRYFNQLGNVALSSAESRVIALNNRELLIHASGIELDQRLYQTCLPEQTESGVVHKGLIPLDFNPISVFGQTAQPVWEGVHQGLDFLQILQADYNGKQRAFGIVRSEIDGTLEVWELTTDELFDTNRAGESRIRWAFETPSYTWGREFDLKTLDTLELWIDQLYGTVDFTVEFRPDQSPCWYYWHHWQECAPRDACELPGEEVPCVYPQQPYKKQFRAMMTMPKPPSGCSAGSGSRPINVGYSFQFRITIHGYCRVRGLVVHAFEKERSNYDGKTC